MFKMIKWFIKFVFFIIFLAITLIVAGQYQLIQSKSGLHVLKRDSWGFSDFYVNTTDWNALEFAKNPRISAKLFKDRFEAIFTDTRDQLQDWWKDLSSDHNVPEIEDIKREFDQTLTQLNKRLRDQKIDIDTYKKRLRELKAETEKKIDQILASLEKK